MRLKTLRDPSDAQPNQALSLNPTNVSSYVLGQVLFDWHLWTVLGDPEFWRRGMPDVSVTAALWR